MPSSPHSPDPSVGILRTYLEGVLPESQLSDATVDADYRPLLLLQTTHAMAAFAFANGDVRKSYEALYGSFKNYYAAQQGRWDALDLSFVFCVQPGLSDLDSFCSNVETNVYFCRKFVVQLASPLASSLARLPFLPLTPISGQSLRPPSAQTFLQQCGVSPTLARFLAVQRERGAERIVEDCTRGIFGEPRELTPVASAPLAHTDPATAPVRLEAVSIENFRAYRKRQTFTVGADVTVLYGPNGFGKTSFFDAIDFGVTGGIGRIESLHDANFAKTAQHLDSKSEDSVVSLSFRSEGALRKVSRTVRDRKHALLDGRPADRRAILTALTGGDTPTTDRVDNFVSLFRATHLFNQEQQELTKGFQADCQLPGQIVSRMLAYEDYANAIGKASKVCELLQAVVTRANREIKELSDEIVDEKKEIDRLGEIAKAHANVAALDAETATLRAKLVAAGLTVSSETTDVAVIRGWRASLESRHSESQSRAKRLSSLATEAAGLPRMRADRVSLQQRLTETELTFAGIEKKRRDFEQTLHRADQRLVEINSKSKGTQADADRLEWVRVTKPRYVQLIANGGLLGEEMKRAADDLAHLQATEAEAAGDVQAQNGLAASAAEKLKSRRPDLAAVEKLSGSVSSWEFNRNRVATVINSEQAAIESLRLLRVEESELSPQVTAITAEEARISRQIAEVDKSQSDLKHLLSQLQRHVHTGTCPLCGEDHGSKDDLIRRIQTQVAGDMASGARIERTGVQERASRLAERVAANKDRQLAANAELAALGEERAKLEMEIGEFVNAALALSVALEGSDLNLSEQLQSKSRQIQQEIDGLDRQVQEVGVASEASRTRLENTKALLASKAAEMADKSARMARLQKEVREFRDDPRLSGVSLDIADEQLADAARLKREQLIELNTEGAKAQADVAQTKPALAATRQESTSLKAQLATLQAQLTSLQAGMTQITARLEDSKLTADVSEEALLRLIAEEARVQAECLALRDSTLNLELALDAATTAAALTQLVQNVRSKEKTIAASARNRDEHRPWLKYFKELSALVSAQQNDAIDTFTREYGPRTSVIQRRLRSVYGFDDIEIRSRESTITVRVRRRGEELRPTDYFSQSQQQTLLLGLFLTACISQTWSTFSPVFLDDPVTHFDDLNTYAFLDLIVGLLESEFGTRQFIISTCDEKLLKLAQQKFRHFGEGAKFYRFSAIGDEGPHVDEIPTGSRAS